MSSTPERITCPICGKVPKLRCICAKVHYRCTGGHTWHYPKEIPTPIPLWDTPNHCKAIFIPISSGDK